MNVLVLTPVYPHQGNVVEGLFNEQHALALTKRGVQVTLVLCKPWCPDWLSGLWPRYQHLFRLPQREEKNDIDLIYARYLHIPKYHFLPFTVHSCANAVMHTLQESSISRKFHLIQVHGVWPVGLAAPSIAKALGCPFVVTLHIQDDPALYHQSSGYKLYQHMLKKAAAIVTVGSPLEKFIQQEISPELSHRVVKIPNGVDLEPIDHLPPRKLCCENPWGHIVSVCNLWLVKGIDLNLRALARLYEEGLRRWHYTIVGDGPERQKLEKLAVDLKIEKQVQFVGRVSHREAMNKIREGDIFSLPSWQEAFGVAYLEAMACGKPVIGCCGEGAEDIIRHEIDGLLVQPKSVENLEGALRRLLENSDFARKLGDSGKSRTQEFTWERNAAQYLSIYQQVCSNFTSGNL
jgi:glycosyltransferase involved in cell wall biosynthesis